MIITGAAPPAYVPRQGHPSLYASLASSSSATPMYFPNSGFRQLNPEQYRYVLLQPVKNLDSRPNMGDYYFDPMMPVELVICGRIPDEQFEKDIAYINELVKKIRQARISTQKVIVLLDILLIIVGCLITWLLSNPSVLVVSVFVTLCSFIAKDALSREYIQRMGWIEKAQKNMAAVGWELIDFKFLASSFVEGTDSIAIKITYQQL
jgi:hypothetical protein